MPKGSLHFWKRMHSGVSHIRNFFLNLTTKSVSCRRRSVSKEYPSFHIQLANLLFGNCWESPVSITWVNRSSPLIMQGRYCGIASSLPGLLTEILDHAWHSNLNWFIQSFMHSFVHRFTDSFIRSFVRFSPWCYLIWSFWLTVTFLIFMMILNLMSPCLPCY